MVEKYDEKVTGHRITVAWVYANPFTGYVHLENFKMYEPGTDSLFFSSQGVSADFSMYKLFHKLYEINKITLSHPYGVIIQNNKDFNFTDLIKKFSSKEIRDTNHIPAHFNILDITIKEGEFYFRNDAIPVNYFIKQVNIESKGKRWDRDSIEATYSFIPGIGTGDIHGNLSFNFAVTVRGELSNILANCMVIVEAPETIFLVSIAIFIARNIAFKSSFSAIYKSHISR